MKAAAIVMIASIWLQNNQYHIFSIGKKIKAFYAHIRIPYTVRYEYLINQQLCINQTFGTYARLPKSLPEDIVYSSRVWVPRDHTSHSQDLPN